MLTILAIAGISGFMCLMLSYNIITQITAGIIVLIAIIGSAYYEAKEEEGED